MWTFLDLYCIFCKKKRKDVGIFQIKLYVQFKLVPKSYFRYCFLLEVHIPIQIFLDSGPACYSVVIEFNLRV